LDSAPDNLPVVSDGFARSASGRREQQWTTSALNDSCMAFFNNAISCPFLLSFPLLTTHDTRIPSALKPQPWWFFSVGICKLLMTNSNRGFRLTAPSTKNCVNKNSVQFKRHPLQFSGCTRCELARPNTHNLDLTGTMTSIIRHLLRYILEEILKNWKLLRYDRNGLVDLFRV